MINCRHYRIDRLQWDCIEYEGVLYSADYMEYIICHKGVFEWIYDGLTG